MDNIDTSFTLPEGFVYTDLFNNISLTNKISLKAYILLCGIPMPLKPAFHVPAPSGIPVYQIAEGRSEKFQEYFLGTHFFNPPRYLKLLEIIPHEKNFFSTALLSITC